jgi:UDP-N-acetylglucosamine/UDP-N-acetylgalactosamine diphosphorylase
MLDKLKIKKPHFF